MEVAQHKDYVTHAVIGGGEAESMGISDDPAFYHMLSSTLYSDEKRAVIRETLCNLWDAHIEAGITDRWGVVTLTDTKLTFQDFGHGIPKHLIKPIYGVYGGSTKKKNDQVTGGFGLGCKAPFSYIDHFEVISCCEGEKTIYRMSKSSGQVLGKPSILPILTVPTTETGITVSMDIKSLSDRGTFERLIREIAAHGEMKIELNGEKIEPLPYSEAVNDYLIIDREEFGSRAANNQSIFVRYGNVIYPVELESSYRGNYNAALAFLKDITASKKDAWYNTARKPDKPDWVLVLLAKPNTISVTPSRESLSMGDLTINTLTDLFAKFITESHDTTQFRNLCFQYARNEVEDIFRRGKPLDALTLDKGLVRTDSIEALKPRFIAKSTDAIANQLLYNFPQLKGIGRFLCQRRLDALLQSGFGHQRLLRSYVKGWRYKKQFSRTTTFYGEEDKYGYRPKTTRKSHPWFGKYLLAPLVTEIKKEPLLSVQNLAIWDSTRYQPAITGHRDNDAIPILGYKPPEDYDQLLPLTRGVVLLGHSRAALEDRAHRMPAMKHWFGSPLKSVCYIVPRNPKRVAAAISFFERMGFYVVDTTARQKWDPTPEEVAEEKAKAGPAPKKKPKLEGFLCLSSLLPDEDMELLFSEAADRIEKPEFVVRIGINSTKVKHFGRDFYFTDRGTRAAFVRRYGARGAIVGNTIQEKALKDIGAKDHLDFLTEQLLEAFKTKPEIESFYRNTVAHNHKRKGDKFDLWGREGFFNAIMRDDMLRRKYGLPKKWSRETLDYIKLAKQFTTQGERVKWPAVDAMHNLIESWTASPELLALVDSLRCSRLLGFLDPDQFEVSLSTQTEEHKKVLRTMLMTALKG